MMLSVLKNLKGTGARRRRVSSAAAFCSVAVLAAGWSSALAAGAGVGATAITPKRGAIPYADRLPNVVLKTHEGRNVRFYDDLIKDKIVLINFMYVTCDGR